MLKIISETDRWLTATQINTYSGDFGCPKRYFYQYKLKLKQNPNIHLIRGGIVHRTLELFFKLKLCDDFDPDRLKEAVLEVFDECWQSQNEQLSRLSLPPAELGFYHEDSKEMIVNWLNSFLLEDPKDLMPLTEQKLFCREHKIWCKADLIKKSKNTFHVIDYKTNKSDVMYDDTKLQLIIQWLCYREKTGNTQHKIGAHYLKFPKSPKLWTPTNHDIEWTLKKIDLVRQNIRSDDIKDYCCTCGGRCRKDFSIGNDGQDKDYPATA